MLLRIAKDINCLNEWIGRTVCWLALFMVLVQFFVVILRYIFGYGSLILQDLVVYSHGFMFMIGAGYTFLKDGHVRVDIFYRGASERYRLLINLWGSVLFLFPFLSVLLYYSVPYVWASWKVREGSPETLGIHGIYLLKTSLLIFVVVIGLQGISYILSSIHSLRSYKRSS